MTETTKTSIVTALTRVSIRAIVTLTSLGVFLGILAGALPADHIQEAGALALVTTGFYFGKEAA